MPSQKNVHQLAEITKSLAESKAVILTEYAGLTVAEQNILRAEAEKTNSSFFVTKNNLLRLALKDKSKELADTLDSFLNGPTAVLFGADAVSAAKTLTKFQEDHDKLKIKTGIMDDKVITIADISALSKLPSYEELLGKLMAQLQAPAQGLVRQLSAPMQNLVYGLDALKTKLSV
ncbi:MAG TPA: 50S ribosomal protein L10 [Candidatus Woesebacteria bacterium]|nr:50S ribosomal protein L10 [Candidatus Woesebacteria bacterium]